MCDSDSVLQLWGRSNSPTPTMCTPAYPSFVRLNYFIAAAAATSVFVNSSSVNLRELPATTVLLRHALLLQMLCPLRFLKIMNRKDPTRPRYDDPI